MHVLRPQAFQCSMIYAFMLYIPQLYLLPIYIEVYTYTPNVLYNTNTQIYDALNRYSFQRRHLCIYNDSPKFYLFM